MAALLTFTSLLICASLISVSNAQTYKKCPSNPLSFCDFYFTGSKASVPTFSLPLNPDQLTGKVLREKYRNTIVQVGNSNSSIVCLSSPKYSGDQFYFSGQQARVTVRNYNDFKRKELENKCIVMRIWDAQIQTVNGTINLGVNDTITGFPKDKRCAVFKTGPNPPNNLSC